MGRLTLNTRNEIVTIADAGRPLAVLVGPTADRPRLLIEVEMPAPGDSIDISTRGQRFRVEPCPTGRAGRHVVIEADTRLNISRKPRVPSASQAPHGARVP